MIAKAFEVRDRGTFIPVIAIKLQPADESERWLFGKSGFGCNPENQAGYIVVHKLAVGKNNGTADPYEWDDGSRTMTEAHKHIRKNFDTMKSGDVVCVEFLKGERPEPKASEREGEIRLMRDAIEDVAAGRLIDHEDVRAEVMGKKEK